jgi:hypothetical protein
MTDDLERILKKLNDFSVDTTKALDDAVRLTALKVQSDSVSAIRKPSKGKTYTRKTVKHTASKPGDAPNTDTGRLIGDIRVAHTKGSAEARVGTDLDYGAILELEKDRPWLKPALDANIDNFAENLEKVLDAQIKKAGK